MKPQFLRNALKIDAKMFAEHCCNIYKNCSNLIHKVAEIYHEFKRNIKTILQLIINISSQSEDEQACLAAVILVALSRSSFTQSALINSQYYEEAD